MRKLKISLIISCAFLIATTTAFLLEAQVAQVSNGSANSTSTPSDVKSRPDSSNSSDWTGTFKAGTRKTFTIKGVEFAFRYCPAGTFTMGSPSSEEERLCDETQHEVRLTQGFWMLETELTQEQWDALAELTQEQGDPLGVIKEEECEFIGKNLPVENVSWDECVAFIDKLNASGEIPKGLKFSLPTEAQWEYACRAGSKTAYFWGDSLNGDKANCNGDKANCYGDCSCGTTFEGEYLDKTSPVKSYDPNPWGLYDMHGNVWEWCSDRYVDYPTGSVVDPTGATNASYRVIRGGSWCSSAELCRSDNRGYDVPADRDNNLGFRFLSSSR